MFFCLSSFTECTCNVVFSDDDATTVCEGGAFVSQQDYTFDPTSNALVLTAVSNGICQDPITMATSSDGESLEQTTTYTLVEDGSLEFETTDGFMTTFWKTSESVDALPELEPAPVPTTGSPSLVTEEPTGPAPGPKFCDMLGMGCTITAAAGVGLGNACAPDRATTPPFLGVDANTVGEFQCNTGQPFGEGGSFLFNANIGNNGEETQCLRFSNCGENANNQGLTIASDILDELIEECEACPEVDPIRLTCTEDFLFRFRQPVTAPGEEDLDQVAATFCGGIVPNTADVDSFNCASGRFVVRDGNRCFQNTPGGPVEFSPPTNGQAIIDACLQCPNVVHGANDAPIA